VLFPCPRDAYFTSPQFFVTFQYSPASSCGSLGPFGTRSICYCFAIPNASIARWYHNNTSPKLHKSQLQTPLPTFYELYLIAHHHDSMCFPSLGLYWQALTWIEDGCWDQHTLLFGFADKGIGLLWRWNRKRIHDLEIETIWMSCMLEWEAVWRNTFFHSKRRRILHSIHSQQRFFSLFPTTPCLTTPINAGPENETSERLGFAPKECELELDAWGVQTKEERGPRLDSHFLIDINSCQKP
jgi:hypothetical protein